MRNEKNRILISENQPGEIRVALLEGNKLSDLDIEYSHYKQKKSNIYKGKISRIEPSLEAVFVDYSTEQRHGFLPFKEIVPSYFKFKGNELQANKNSLKIGQEVMVQIEKEERGNKGAALTTYITLPGSYLVLMPNNPDAGGISRRIEGNERLEMQNLLNQIPISEGMGLILRTAGVGRELNELKNDLSILLKQWDAIKKAFSECSAPHLIFQEGDLITRSIRDYLSRDIDEIIIDNKKIYEKARDYIAQIRSDFVQRISFYQNPTPLFMHFGIEEAIESAFQREVRLASGGTIVIDPAEALVAVDINSGRSTKNEDIEETAVKTNLEAAKEIAHQLRIRDLGGLIVIDFIDMNSEDNKRRVENCLREATKKDRARIQIGRISSFGLLEMSRQRLRHSLGRASEIVCQHCHGQGTLRSIELLTLSLIRLIEKEALKKSTQQVRVEVPVDMLTYLINEKRMAISQIEQRYNITLLLIPNPYWQFPQYKITAIGKNTGVGDIEKETASYQLIEDKSSLEISTLYIPTSLNPIESPAVKSPIFSANKNKTKTRLGILSRLFSMLTDLTKPKTESPVITPLPKKENYPSPSRRHPRYGKPTRNNRLRGYRREGGQHNHYATRQTKRYDQPLYTKPSTEERGLKENLLKETTLVTDNKLLVKKQKKENSPINRPIKSIEEKTTTSSQPSPKTARSNQEQCSSEISTNNNIVSQSTPDTTHSHRRNTRRYGGEPKLRRRTYAYGTPDNKTGI